ncbi:uncharacterized protein LOC131614288 [Vicia villosa]|uniref:uncharacterized protein LOC131614288 n=1 Tax=Vicia villosa TaxID=3911 RepID=UPI00273BEBB5|nr:uncharacterized protein LOC131614288 [Vicia villosa]
MDLIKPLAPAGFKFETHIISSSSPHSTFLFTHHSPNPPPQPNTTQIKMQMQTPTTGTPKLRPRSGRTPLQPKNTPADLTLHPFTKPKLKPDQSCFEITLVPNTDKENLPFEFAASATSSPVTPLETLETSLGEELSAMKKKLERLRTDKEKTEKMLKEREALLDAKMKEMKEKSEIQKNLEIQVDRLFRLKELKYRCMRVSPIRTLREKEHEKINNQAPSPSEVRTEEPVAFESVSESESVKEECEVVESPGSACSQTRTIHTKSDN